MAGVVGFLVQQLCKENQDVYLGVVVLSVGEVCCEYEGYVGSAVVLYIWGNS